MLIPLAYLSLAAVLINDVRMDNSGGDLTVDVVTSEPVARTDVRGVSGGSRRMFVYLQGTETGRSSFGDGRDAVVVHPRARYTKLEIPTHGRCAEPMTVEATPVGIRVRASCQDSNVQALVPPVRLPSEEHAEQPSPDAPMAALARNRSQTASLRAALALPAEATDKESEATPADDSDHGAAAAESSDKKARAGTAVPAVHGQEAENAAATAGNAAAAGQAAPLATTTQPDAPMAAVATAESSNPSSTGNVGGAAKSSSSVVSTVLAVLLLAGLGVAAALLARRRATRVRMIHIIETASIGPRRSLVVACIGGRTMVLGVSEAGVSLLDAQAGPIGLPATLEKTQSATLEEAALGLRGLAQGGSEARGDPTEDAKHEGSLLSRLFHQVVPPSSADRREQEFNELLSESLEDQDLRRRLSMGEVGRVA
jgi:flagellar biogenesis protein FliO